MDTATKRNLVTYLTGFVVEDRLKRIEQVLSERTRYVTVVLEDIYQPHNASAVLRSCECFGIQDVHIIENENKFEPTTGVTVGSDRWLTLHRYTGEGKQNTEQCIRVLRDRQYRIIAMTPHADDTPISKLAIGQKTALMFGTELEGLSEYALEQADGFARIPMYGFSESFNISVSAALSLYEVTGRLRESGIDWKLTGEEVLELKLEWLKNSIRAGDELVEKFLNE